MSDPSRFAADAAVQAELAALIELLGLHFFAEYDAAKAESQYRFALSQADGDETNQLVVDAKAVSTACAERVQTLRPVALARRTELQLEPLNLSVKSFIAGVKWCGAYTARPDTEGIGSFGQEKETAGSPITFQYRAEHTDDFERPEKRPIYRIFLAEIPQSVLLAIGMA